MAGTTDASHQLHQVATEIPKATATAEMGRGVGKQTFDHIRGSDSAWCGAVHIGIHAAPAQGVGVGRATDHGAIAVLQGLQTILR